MDQALRSLPFVYVNIDNVLIASATPEEHLEHLHKVFEHLTANGIVVNANKCVFGVEELDLLGHHIDLAPLSLSRARSIQSLISPNLLLSDSCGVSLASSTFTIASYHMVQSATSSSRSTQFHI